MTEAYLGKLATDTYLDWPTPHVRRSYEGEGPRRHPVYTHAGCGGTLPYRSLQADVCPCCGEVWTDLGARLRLQPRAEIREARLLIADIDYRYTAAPAGQHSSGGEAINGWINGIVTLKDGRSFKAGGGWVDLTGLVEAYNFRDAGQVEELADALDLDTEDTMELLRADCPRDLRL